MLDLENREIPQEVLRRPTDQYPRMGMLPGKDALTRLPDCDFDRPLDS